MTGSFPCRDIVFYVVRVRHCIVLRQGLACTTKVLCRDRLHTMVKKKKKKRTPGIGGVTLSELIPNSKVVRKILRSLLEIYRAKVVAIEESKDVDSLKLDELVGSLQTFEMTLKSPMKSKGIALNAIKEEVRK